MSLLSLRSSLSGSLTLGLVILAVAVPMLWKVASILPALS